MSESEYTGGTIGPELTPEFWNTVFGWLPWFPQVSEPTATPTAVVVILGVVLFSVVMFVAGERGGSGSNNNRSEAADSEQEEYYESANQYDGGGDTGIFEDIEEIQKTIISTSSYEKDTRIPQIGDDQHFQIFYVPGVMYPKIPIDGYLEAVLELTDVKYNGTVYFDRQDKDRTAARLKSKVATAAAETANSSLAEMQGKAGRQGRIADIFAEVEDGETPFKISTYVMVRGETKEDVAKARGRMKEVFNDYPVKQPLRTAVGQQKQALQSVLPIGRDVLGDTDQGKFKSTTLAGAFGAAYASAIKPTTVDPDGIEYGWHKSTQLPLILDPWGHDAGNAMVMVADPGGGKSTTGKALMQRVLSQREDVIGVTIEPMANWAGVTEIFKSEKENPGEYEGSAHITVGGDKGINPLQIREIPPAQRQELPDDVDPLGDRKEIAMSFLENFFTMRGVHRRFNEYRRVCENALDDAYNEAKIYHDDLDSHGRESPTLRDLRNDQMKDRLHNPEKYADEKFRETEIRKAAQWFYSQFEVFDIRENSDGEKIKGSYANFGKQTEFDIFGNKYVYLDLGQSEGNVSEKAKLTMQILLDQVYEMSKQTDKKVVLAMDEFRYFIRDVANIDSIENLFRHHRHQDIAPWIMTQTVHEFLQRPESEAILDMCPYFLGQRYDKMNTEDAQKLGLTVDQYKFVSSQAQPGTPERGYADALLLSGDSGRKLEVHLTDSELAVSEWDRDDPKSMLPGFGSETESIEDEITEDVSESEGGEAEVRISSQRRKKSNTRNQEYENPTPSKSIEEFTSQLDSESEMVESAENGEMPKDTEPEQHTEPDTDEAESTSPTDTPVGQDTGLDAGKAEPDSDTDTSEASGEESRSTADIILNRLFSYFEDDEGDDDETKREDEGSLEPVTDISEVEREFETQLNDPDESSEKEDLSESNSPDPESEQSIVERVKTRVSEIPHRIKNKGENDSPDPEGDTVADPEIEQGSDSVPDTDDIEEMWGSDEGEIYTTVDQPVLTDRSEPEPQEPDQAQPQEDQPQTQSTSAEKADYQGDTSADNTDQPTMDTESIVADPHSPKENQNSDTQPAGDGNETEHQPETDPNIESESDQPLVADTEPETLDSDSNVESVEGKPTPAGQDEQERSKPQKREPPSFAQNIGQDTNESDESIDEESAVPEPEQEENTISRQEAKKREPPSFASFGRTDSDSGSDPKQADQSPSTSVDSEQEITNGRTQADKEPQADLSDEVAGGSEPSDEASTEPQQAVDQPPSLGEPENESVDEKQDDPFGFGTSDEPSDEDVSSDESGDISFLLDEESREKIKQENQVSQSDPFGDFEEESKSPSEKKEESNLSFLTENNDTTEDQSEDTEVEDSVNSPTQTDGGRDE